jgi:hypothetical protein
MRSWASASLAVALIALAAVAMPAQKSPAHSSPARNVQRFNETMLAGLRPGRDAASRAVHLYKEPLTKESEWQWQAVCSKQLLSIDTDQSRKIQTIRVFDARWIPGDCDKYRPTPWRTGRGLRIGSPAPYVVQLYGEPDSRSPSTKNGQRLELLYYAFDWAGPDVPQVMEVLCSLDTDGKPGRVVEITLAASSL